MAKRQKLNDGSPMPWGIHKGTAMSVVPSEYLLWLYQQKWIKEWPDVNEYLVKHIDGIKSEAEFDDPDEPTGEFESYADYHKHGRHGH